MNTQAKIHNLITALKQGDYRFNSRFSASSHKVIQGVIDFVFKNCLVTFKVMISNNLNVPIEMYDKHILIVNLQDYSMRLVFANLARRIDLTESIAQKLYLLNLNTVNYQLAKNPM